MKIINNKTELKAELDKLRREKGGTTGLVPTMGALHEGHLSLVRRCKKENEIVVVSIFVNPTQFGPNEDYEKYPRTLEKDSELLQKEGVDIVFAPSPKDIYSNYYFEHKETTLICPPYDCVNKLCGKSRTGHFDGVCTIVGKLFNLTECENAYFGQKDAQQLFIIKRMVEDLDFKVKITGCPIVRESDNLALSSRNTYLTPEARKIALQISTGLFKAKELSDKGIKESGTLIDTALACMTGLEVEYTEIVDLDSFEKIDIIEQKGLMLIAAKVKSNDTTVRLIDNIEL